MLLENERCEVHRLGPGSCLELFQSQRLLLLSAGGTLREEVSCNLLQVPEGNLHAAWEPFSTKKVRLRGLDGMFYIVQVYGTHTFLAPSTLALDDGVRTDVGTKLLIENALVRVWAFEVEAGRACHVHRHVRDYFFLNMVESNTLALDQRGEPDQNATASRQEEGQLTFVRVRGPSYPVHGLVNVGLQTFRQFVVEFQQPLSRL